MKPSLLVCLLLLQGAWAHAQWSTQIGQDVRYLEASNGRSIHAEYPINLRAGYLLGPWGFFAEYSEYTSLPEGNSNLWVKAGQISSMLWVRRNLTESFGPFLGAGAGYYQDRVQTSFYGTSHKNYAEHLPVLALEGGAWYQVLGPMTAEINVSVRTGSESTPASQWSIGTKLGFLFE